MMAPPRRVRVVVVERGRELSPRFMVIVDAQWTIVREVGAEAARLAGCDQPVSWLAIDGFLLQPTAPISILRDDDKVEVFLGTASHSAAPVQGPAEATKAPSRKRPTHKRFDDVDGAGGPRPRASAPATAGHGRALGGPALRKQDEARQCKARGRGISLALLYSAPGLATAVPSDPTSQPITVAAVHDAQHGAGQLTSPRQPPLPDVALTPAAAAVEGVVAPSDVTPTPCGASPDSGALAAASDVPEGRSGPAALARGEEGQRPPSTRPIVEPPPAGTDIVFRVPEAAPGARFPTGLSGWKRCRVVLAECQRILLRGPAEVLGSLASEPEPMEDGEEGGVGEHAPAAAEVESLAYVDFADLFDVRTVLPTFAE